MRPTLAFRNAWIVLSFSLFVSGAEGASKTSWPQPPPDPHLIATIEGPTSAFGTFVANVGDVDGDGFEDLLAADPGWFGGEAFLYFGGAADTTIDLVIRKPQLTLSYGFGEAVAGGDANGDGFSDIAIGDPFAYPNWGDGACYVYMGSSNPDAQPDLVLHNPEPQNLTRQFFAAALATIDIDRDGFADLIVGKAADPVDRGRAYVLRGGSSLGGEWGLAFRPPDPPAMATIGGLGFPAHTVRTGDVNGDGFDDLLVSENGLAPPPSPAGHGRASLFLGGSPYDTLPDAFLAMTPHAIPGLEQPISTAGDLNADGFEDLIVDAPLANGDASSGLVYVYYGSGSPASYPVPALILGPVPGLDGQPDSTFGQFVYGGKDVSGDGIPDILVATTGTVFVFLGGPGADATPDFTLQYDAFREASGTILTACDWNGDGVDDVVVGSSRYGSSLRGRIYVFDVSRSLDARAFTLGEHRTIALAQPCDVAFRVQPAGGSYENSDVDPSAWTLAYETGGNVTRIASVEAKKTMAVGDTDHDGVPELPVSFAAEDLVLMFAGVQGRQEVEVVIEGRLLDGRRLRAPTTLTLVGLTGLPPRIPVRVAPNPVNPQGILEFTMPAPGAVRLQLYDVAGRCVRTLLDGEMYDAGAHRILFTTRDDRGEPLPSGIFFYRLVALGVVRSGRLVVAK